MANTELVIPQPTHFFKNKAGQFVRKAGHTLFDAGTELATITKGTLLGVCPNYAMVEVRVENGGGIRDVMVWMK